MKKLLIITLLAITMVQVQSIAATSANNKKPAVKPGETKSTSVKTNDKNVYPTSGADYLWKYNIDDLEAAPWLHDGKRVY